MATHKISLELTTDQLTHLNNALNEHQQANLDALVTPGFRNERSDLLKQCEALQVFIDTIESIVNGEAHA